jgi:hypothetical protein
VPPVQSLMKPRVFLGLILVPLLSACSYTMNQNPFMGSVVQSQPLGDGKVVNVGYQLPDASAGCQLMDETSRNWAMAQTTGQFKPGGGRQVLQDDAVAAVKQRPQDDINFIALTIPNEAGVGILNVTAGANAKTSYFHCASPPQPH